MSIQKTAPTDTGLAERDLTEAIGEDPVRVRDTCESDGVGSDIDDTPEFVLAFAQIRGIQSIDILEWFDLKQDLPQGPHRYVVADRTTPKNELQDPDEQAASRDTSSSGASA